MRQKIIVSAVAWLYFLFWRWYTGKQKPLTPNEIEKYLQKLAERNPDPVVFERMQAFLQNDTGHSFIMVNFIKLNDQPNFTNNDRTPLTETSEAVLNRYNSAFLPGILKRACHPILFGKAAAQAVEVWGIPGGEEWTMVGLVRYRSRRDMIEAATAPGFQEIHGFKVAAIEKTIAVPIEPLLQLGDPRVFAGMLALLSILITNSFKERKSKTGYI
jgi:hypothetical protein